MKSVERVVNNLERAGGSVTNASAHATAIGIDDALLVRFGKVNRLLADLRRATVMLENGEPLEAVLETADLAWKETP